MGLAISPRHEMAPQHGHRRPRGRPSTPVPYLRLVGPSERTVTIPSQRRPADPDNFHTIKNPAPIRLTRRGRIVIWLVLAGLALVALALLAPASQAAAPSGPARAVTVRPGDTMWSIATNALPGVAPAVAVERVRAFNHLPDNKVYVGEQILLPATNS